MYEEEDNDGKFPDESPVEVRYPRSKQEEQATASGGRGCREPSQRFYSSDSLSSTSHRRGTCSR
ncbi:MAG TPA: hypothetical protein VLW50_10070 [Streptosporangiaceae bacterium]|nr:hypothetical protein [Streptosporangiaceae bacterium]